MATERITRPWAEWRPGCNPYRRTPFQVVGIAPSVKGRAVLKNAINQRRRRIQNTPERFLLFGRPLDVAEVNEAENRILNAEARLYAELCTHRPRVISLDLGDAPGRLAEITPPIPTPQRVLETQRLARFVPALVQRTFSALIEV